MSAVRTAAVAPPGDDDDSPAALAADSRRALGAAHAAAASANRRRSRGKQPWPGSGPRPARVGACVCAAVGGWGAEGRLQGEMAETFPRVGVGRAGVLVCSFFRAVSTPLRPWRSFRGDTVCAPARTSRVAMAHRRCRCPHPRGARCAIALAERGVRVGRITSGMRSTLRPSERYAQRRVLQEDLMRRAVAHAILALLPGMGAHGAPRSCARQRNIGFLGPKFTPVARSLGCSFFHRNGTVHSRANSLVACASPT